MICFISDASVASVFDPMDKPESSTGPSKAVVFVCHRHNHVPVLHIRTARSEESHSACVEETVIVYMSWPFTQVLYCHQ